MPREVQTHYVKPNERNWSPSSLIFLDTETETATDGETEIETLRLWCARYTDRKRVKKTEPRHVTGWGHDSTSLAAWVDHQTRNRETVWLYAHNLGFDLTTTRLPVHLVQLGWTVTDASVGGKAPWMRLAKGRRILTMLDSWSWLPASLDVVGEAVRVSKPPLPKDGHAEHVWRARCGSDVDILATAILDLMAWWDRDKLGNWTISGAGCGWNAYRHRPTSSKVTVDASPEGIAADRLTVHGGRRGTWSIGEHRAGPFLELDFAAAYPQIAAECPLPIKRSWRFTSLPLDHPNLSSDRWGVSAHCRVRTDTAHWPVRVGGSTWYPVGEYWADLAGPDITEALRLGELLEIGPGYTHKLGRNMNPWGRWVLAVQRGELPDTPAVAKIAAKSWGRSVIGKWAARSFERTRLGTAPTYGWGFEEGWDVKSGTRGGYLDLAGQRWWIAASASPDDCYPAVLAWVESEVRVRLNRAIDAIGQGAILQCDTDGMIVAVRTIGTKAARGTLVAPEGLGGAARVRWVLDHLADDVAPLTLRIKNQASHVTVIGPQHVQVDAQRKFSGMPKDSKRGADGKYRARIWPSLRWQMEHGSTAGYVRPLRTTTITGPYPTGWILQDRTVVPVETSVRPDGATVITPWHLTRYAKSGLHRADVQHRLLDDIS
jgi:hypothetical protein